jgi:hypothetical protein
MQSLRVSGPETEFALADARVSANRKQDGFVVPLLSRPIL